MLVAETDVTIFTMAAEQLQFSSHGSENSPDQQHQSLQRRGRYKYNRNPIVSSPQYQAYRGRQSKDDGNKKSNKWPDILESAFLDALLDLPQMGREKFSYNGKPHGRNELISEYLRIAYHQSLRPGQRPDRNMTRDRKQVSSHIQVLKGFLKDHPASSYLFPKAGSGNLFGNEFDSDPCLRAISQGRLPPWRYDARIKPAIFWILVASTKIQDNNGDLYEESAVTHRYSGLSRRAHDASLDSITNWSERFPYLEAYYNTGELDCDIIHMDVALNLMETHPHDGADLVTRSEVSVTSHDNGSCEWQSFTSLIKPPKLCGDYGIEQSSGVSVEPAKILSSNANEIRLKVRFPAEEWALLFTCLTDVQLKYRSSEPCQPFGCEPYINREQLGQEYLRQVSMYQEIQSCSGPGAPFVRRAIILWTFRAVTPGEKTETTWRSLDTASLLSCASPSSQSGTHVSTGTTNKANSSLQLYDDTSDLYMHDIATPPSTAGPHPEFTAENYGYGDHHFHIPQGSFSTEAVPFDGSGLSFANNSATENIGAYMSNAAHSRIASFGHLNLGWDGLPSSTIHAGPAWANYEAISSNASHSESESMAIDQSWHMDMDPRLSQWTECKDEKGNWVEMAHTKQQPLYIEQNNDSLLTWLNPVDDEMKSVYIDTDDVQLPILPSGSTDAKDPSWMGSDSSFDFNQLGERIKA